MSPVLHAVPARDAVIHAYDALRARMGGSDEQYAYAAVRRRLIQFFRLHVPQQAEALADATLVRLTRKVEGLLIDSFPAYVLSIARLVAHEAKRGSAHGVEAVACLPTEADDAVAAAFAAQDVAAGDLLLAYFGGDARAREPRRVALAASHGVSPQALRARALRTREALERSVLAHDSRGAAPAGAHLRMAFLAGGERR